MNRENSRDSSKEKLSLERLPTTDEQFLTTDYFQKAKFQAARQYISKKIDEQAKKETSHRHSTDNNGGIGGLPRNDSRKLATFREI